MRSTNQLPLAFLLPGFLLLIGIGCRIPAPTPQPTAAAATETPTPVSTPVTPSPRPSDIRLSFPATITPDDKFFVTVSNEGSVPYVYLESPSPNCLSIRNANGDRVPTIPDGTCDALAEIIVRPGQSNLVYGSWNLTVCSDEDCLTPEAAAPGLYHFSATFAPYLGEDTSFSESGFTFEEAFTLLPASK